MLEAKYKAEWVNIDHWCRKADGTLRHQYLLAVSERDAFSCDYDELAKIKCRLQFHELSSTTREIIQAENPSFKPEVFDSFDFFHWGTLDELERLLDKKIEDPCDFSINRSELQGAVSIAQEELLQFRRSIPYEKDKPLPMQRDVTTRIVMMEI